MMEPFQSCAPLSGRDILGAGHSGTELVRTNIKSKAFMFPSFPTLHNRNTFPATPAAHSAARRQPFHGEPAFKVLAPGIQLSNDHAVSTGDPGIRHAQWEGRNTVNIGMVNEDVAGITLSGRHTFPNHVLDEAHQVQQRNPGLILYLGLPPTNPQKYVPVLPPSHARSDANTSSSLATPVSISLTQRPEEDLTGAARAARRADAARHQLNRLVRSGSTVPRARQMTDRRMQIWSSSSNDVLAEESPASRTRQTGNYLGAAADRGPTPLTSPVDWGPVRRQLTASPPPVVADDMRKRQRDVRRMALGLPPRSRAIAPGKAAGSSSRQPDPATLPLVIAITTENMHSLAARALQRAVGTFPGLPDATQQYEWVRLLNQTLEAHEIAQVGYARAKNGKRLQRALGQMEEETRVNLRQLLEASSLTDVFNFGSSAPPASIEELDNFVARPQFRLLVAAVNAAYRNM